jgi:hypothetical protein
MPAAADLTLREQFIELPPPPGQKVEVQRPPINRSVLILSLGQVAIVSTLRKMETGNQRH